MEKMNEWGTANATLFPMNDWKSNHRRYRRAPCGTGTTQSLHRQIKRRKRRYARAIKCKAAHGGFEVPTGLSAAEQIAKPWKTVKGQDKRAAPALDGFSCPCYGTIKRAQTDRPLAPSLNYGVFCYAVGVKKALFMRLCKGKMRVGKGFIRVPLKMAFYCVTSVSNSSIMSL